MNKNVKDTVKKILKKFFRLRVLCIIAAVLVLFSIFQLATRDKFAFKIETLSSYSVNDNIDLDITVYKQGDMSHINNYYYDTYQRETLSDKLFKKLFNDNVKLKVSLYDSEGKKVKGTNETIKATLKEVNNVEIDLPEDLEPGTYVLKAKAKKGLLYDYVEKDLNLNTSISDVITISMDKGIYKPGDEVKFRALITENIDSTPVENDVSISIYDGNENRVYYEETKTSEFGIVSGSFNLAAEVNSGNYKLAVKVGNKEKVQAFKVDSYTEERFKLEIENAKNVFSTTEDVVVHINANYFFGEPVVDAAVEIIDVRTKEVKKGKTDSNGNLQVRFDKQNAGTYNYLVKMTDVSNYYVEKNHEVVVTDSLYNIEIAPEYGDIVKGVKNRIYFYVKDLEKNPVEARCTFSSEKVTREFTTDSEGVGWIELSSADVNKINEVKSNKFYLTIITEDGNYFEHEELFNVINVNNVIRTDKVLYNQGETIEYSLGNFTENEEKLFVVKNGELINTVNVTNEDGIIELENVYGLIDLYMVGKIEGGNSRLNKRTVFVKPKDDMKITLSTDATEYKPSDNMTLNISNSTQEDVAYLVSIIDTANLNMADNDLNIDKIKLALEDVKFTDGVDAATVYGAIMANANETELEKLLMKQSSTVFSISNVIEYPDIDLEIFGMIIFGSIVTVLVAIALIFTIYNITGRDDNRLFNVLSRSLIIVVVLSILLTILIYEILDISEFVSMILAIIISVVTYNKVLFKYDKYIAKNIYELIITWAVCMGIYGLLAIVMLLGGPLFFITAIILGIIIYKTRKSFIVKFLKEICIVTIKNLIILFLAYIFTGILDEIFTIRYSMEEVVYIIVVISLYVALFKYRKDRSEYKQNYKSTASTVKHKDLFYYIGVGFVIFCVLSTLGIVNVVNNFSGNVSIDSAPVYKNDFNVNTNSSNSGFIDEAIDVSQFAEKSDTSGSSSNLNFDLDFGFIDSFSQSIESAESVVEDMVQVESTIGENVSQEEIVKIRNVFLESLAFIPEVIAESGNTNVDIKLSDNITTWKVQVVGNTKEGNIGYSNTEFKVFKEFFVDFTVPNNLKVGDKISIPASVYNYTENALTVNLNVKEDSWFKIISTGEYNVTVNPDGQELVYIDIEIVKQSDENKLRIEASSNGLKDIIEKIVPVDFKGIDVSEISANGSTDEDISGEVLFNKEFIEGSNSVTVNLYPNLMSFAIEGMDSILRMPTGCFEQVSSSLYPDIMVLAHLENAELTDENKALKEKAKDYINKGYQKILTYEVIGEPGGFSLYGNPKAETVLTAYGLMELNDLSKVYSIDEKVLERMEKFLSNKQNNDGSFEATGHSYVVNTNGKVSNTAYILWALSEYNPESKIVEKGVKYIKENIEDVDDNYTLALMINTLVNVKDSSANKYIDKLLDEVREYGESNCKYLVSDSSDYMGTRGSRMNIQTTALLSMALSKEGTKNSINQELINYIINQRGKTSWGTTQATVLALRAINVYNNNAKTADQKIEVTVGNQTKEVELKKSGITFVNFNFDNLENADSVYYDISGVKSNIYYEVIKNYYVEYDKYEGNDVLEVVNTFSNTSLNVNDVLTERIYITNKSTNNLDNVMVEVQIPQGFVLVNESLEKLVATQEIEKYETNYGKVYIYLRNLNKEKVKDFKIEFRASYPVDITGGAVKVYDYYNPEIVEYVKPVDITVSK